jgi:tripartite ATP-independent transporter DctP family solute receptor
MSRAVSRRTIVGTFVAAPAILTFGRGAFAQAQTTLSLGHGAAPTNPRHIAAEKFAEVVKQKSGGRIAIRVAPSDQLGNEASLLTSLRTGAVDMCVNSQGTCSALVPEIAALGLPFLFNAPAAAFKLLDGPFGNVIGERFAKVGILPLGFWDNGIRHVTNSKRAINTPEDLKGLKLRTPPDPMTIDIFQSAGAATQQIAFGELYVALQQGVVDGQENPLANIASAKIYEVNPFISMTGHKWESTPFLMSNISWAKLAAADKDIVKAAAAEAGALQRKIMGDADAKFLGEFKANAKLKVNEADKAAFRKATASVVDTWKKKPFGDFVAQLVKAAA